MSRFSISTNKTILDPSGNRFIVRGVTMFDYLFVSHESRSDYSYRELGRDPTKTAASGVSEPTYYARVSYVGDAHIGADLVKAKAMGVNLIRVAVEPAMLKASITYVDSTDGVTYQSDLSMLDTIVATATALGIVIQLQNGNDKVPVSTNIEFLKFLAARYSNNAYVWINPANELNGSNGSGNVNNIAVWHLTMSQYIAAIRSVQFLNPIVINPPQFGENLLGIVGTINTNAVYNSDPNLIIGVHLYPQLGQYDFRTTRLPTETNSWFQFVNNFCIFVDEVGINNYGTTYDPDLNPGYPSASPDEWVRMRSWCIDFLDWVYQQSNHGALNGATGISWYAYIPGMNIVDLNSMIKFDGTYSLWGQIFTGYTSKPDLIVPTPVEGEWNSYNPIVMSGNGSLASYTATGRFFRLNTKTRLIQVTVCVTGNGNGSGILFVTLPDTEGLPAYASQSLSGIQIVSDYALTIRASEGSNMLRVKKYDGSYCGGSGSQMIISGFYEVAS